MHQAGQVYLLSKVLTTTEAAMRPAVGGTKAVEPGIWRREEIGGATADFVGVFVFTLIDSSAAQSDALSLFACGTYIVLTGSSVARGFIAGSVEQTTHRLLSPLFLSSWRMILASGSVLVS